MITVDVGRLLEHPLTIVAAAAIVSAAGWAIQATIRARRDRSARDAALGRTLQAIERDLALIAPHFRPPKPGEPDTSVPGRLLALEANGRQMRADFVDHMDAEMRKHDEHRRERTEDRTEMRSTAQRIHDRLDELIAFVHARLGT